jgi:hypothetical protein
LAVNLRGTVGLSCQPALEPGLADDEVLTYLQMFSADELIPASASVVPFEVLEAARLVCSPLGVARLAAHVQARPSQRPAEL